MDNEVNLYGPLPFTVRVIVKGYDKIGGPVGCGKRDGAPGSLIVPDSRRGRWSSAWKPSNGKMLSLRLWRTANPVYNCRIPNDNESLEKSRLLMTLFQKFTTSVLLFSLCMAMPLVTTLLVYLSSALRTASERQRIEYNNKLHSRFRCPGCGPCRNIAPHEPSVGRAARGKCG